MQNRVDKYLPFAFKAIEQVRIDVKKEGATNPKYVVFKNKEGKIPKEYKGYISQFGASIIQAGVITALTFYEAEEQGSAQDRRLIVAAIKFIIDKTKDFEEKLSEFLQNNEPKPEEIKQKKKDIMEEITKDFYSDCKLSECLRFKDDEAIQYEAEKIMDAATALKLVLRTYEMTE